MLVDIGVTLPVSTPSIVTFAPAGKLDTLSDWPNAVMEASRNSRTAVNVFIGFVLLSRLILLRFCRVLDAPARAAFQIRGCVRGKLNHIKTVAGT